MCKALVLVMATEKGEVGLELDLGRVTFLDVSGGGLTGDDLSRGRDLKC